MLDQVRQYRHVCIELDLPGHVKDDQVLLGDFFERVRQEVEVFQQELKTVYQAPVGAQAHLLHDIFEADQVFDVDVRLEGEVFGGRVEIDIEARALVVLEVLD
jgi:hypothetical protein